MLLVLGTHGHLVDHSGATLVNKLSNTETANMRKDIDSEVGATPRHKTAVTGSLVDW